MFSIPELLRMLMEALNICSTRALSGAVLLASLKIYGSREGSRALLYSSVCHMFRTFPPEHLMILLSRALIVNKCQTLGLYWCEIAILRLFFGIRELLGLNQRYSFIIKELFKATISICSLAICIVYIPA